METLQRLPFKARQAVFDKLEQIVDIASLSKEDRMKYDESIKIYRDNLAVMSFAEANGREKEKISIARQMKAKGFPTELIAEITKLSKEDIEQL